MKVISFIKTLLFLMMLTAHAGSLYSENAIDAKGHCHCRDRCRNNRDIILLEGPYVFSLVITNIPGGPNVRGVLAYSVTTPSGLVFTQPNSEILIPANSRDVYGEIDNVPAEETITNNYKIRATLDVTEVHRNAVLEFYATIFVGGSIMFTVPQLVPVTETGPITVEFEFGNS